MKKQLQVSLVLINDEVRFHAAAPDKNPIIVDYLSSPDDKEGHTSLELLLISASSCLATAVKMMVKGRLKKEISAIQVTAEGIRREAHPTGFSSMKFTLQCVAEDLAQTSLDSILHTAKEHVCPVFAMLRGDIETDISATISKPPNAAMNIERGAK